MLNDDIEMLIVVLEQVVEADEYEIDIVLDADELDEFLS